MLFATGVVLADDLFAEFVVIYLSCDNTTLYKQGFYPGINFRRGIGRSQGSSGERRMREDRDAESDEWGGVWRGLSRQPTRESRGTS